MEQQLELSVGMSGDVMRAAPVLIASGRGPIGCALLGGVLPSCPDMHHFFIHHAASPLVAVCTPGRIEGVNLQCFRVSAALQHARGRSSPLCVQRCQSRSHGYPTPTCDHVFVPLSPSVLLPRLRWAVLASER